MRKFDRDLIRAMGSAQMKLFATGGFTLNLDTLTYPTSGYAVSCDKGFEEKFRHVTVAELVLYALDHEETLNKSGRHMGAWYNDQDGYVYLDVSVVTENRLEAIALGYHHNQIAVYDIANREEIVL